MVWGESAQVERQDLEMTDSIIADSLPLPRWAFIEPCISSSQGADSSVRKAIVQAHDRFSQGLISISYVR